MSIVMSIKICTKNKNTTLLGGTSRQWCNYCLKVAVALLLWTKVKTVHRTVFLSLLTSFHSVCAPFRGSNPPLPPNKNTTLLGGVVWCNMDTLRSQIRRPPRAVPDGFCVLETLAVRKTCRGFASASPNQWFSIKHPLPPNKNTTHLGGVVWWERMDSNHRSQRQQIYSLPPLATRELSHI